MALTLHLPILTRRTRSGDKHQDDRYRRLAEAKRYINDWRAASLRDLLRPVAQILRLPADEVTYALLVRIHISDDVLDLVEELVVEYAH